MFGQRWKRRSVGGTIVDCIGLRQRCIGSIPSIGPSECSDGFRAVSHREGDEYVEEVRE
jgi:hypothetical protein